MIRMFSGYISKLPRLLSYLFSILLVGTYMLSAVSPVGAVSTIKNKLITVGSVDAVHGKVWGVPLGVPKSIKSIGDVVVKDEVISTGYKSSVSMTFVDNTVLKMGADATITIDEMVYDPTNDNKDSVIFKLGAGAFYFISGKVAKQKVTLITPTTTIGIRGTELIIHVDSDGATSVGVTKGRAFMRSRENGSSNEIELGSTGRSDGKGNVSQSRQGIDLTGDEGIDRNVDGLSDWLGEDEKKKEQEKDYTEFTSENPENSDAQDENGDAYGDENSGGEGDGQETDGAESDGGNGEGGDEVNIEGEASGESGGENSSGEGDGTDSGDGTDGGDGSDGGSGLDASSGSDGTSGGSSSSSEGEHD